MADTIKRDKSGMWTEMPPSAKNRKPDVRQPIPAPVPENNNSNSKAGKKSDKKKADKKGARTAPTAIRAKIPFRGTVTAAGRFAAPV